jgi:hypothetical protein
VHRIQGNSASAIDNSGGELLVREMLKTGERGKGLLVVEYVGEIPKTWLRMCWQDTALELTIERGKRLVVEYIGGIAKA